MPSPPPTPLLYLLHMCIHGILKGLQLFAAIPG